MKHKQIIENKNRHGFVLVLAMLMISVLMLIMSGLFYTVTSYNEATNMSVRVSKARLMALSGLSIGMSLLTPAAIKDDGKSEILKTINQWHHTVFDMHGIDGSIDLYCSALDGMFDINKLYNFKKHTWKKIQKSDAKSILEKLFAKSDKAALAKIFFTDLDKFLSTCKRPLDDVMQLWGISGVAAMFDGPFVDHQGTFFLTDVFMASSWVKKEKWIGLNPLVISASVAHFARLIPQKKSNQEENSEFEKKLKELALPAQLSTQLDWFLLPVLGKKFEEIKTGQLLEWMGPLQLPKEFLIISHGTYEKVTVKLAAIMKRIVLTKKLSTPDSSIRYRIVKIYWL
jgi:hypothetical protein